MKNSDREFMPEVTFPVNSLCQELKQCARSLARRPGLSFVIVFTLALGIGANTALFSVVNTVLLKPLPFRDSDRLVHIWENYPKRSRYHRGSDQGYIIVRPATYFDWKAQSRSFSNLTAFAWRSVMLTGRGPSQSLQAHEVDADFFSTLGVAPALGRVLQADDFLAGNGDRPLVLSYPLWQARFAGDRSIVGRKIVLDNADYTVAGVMPEGFYPTRWETPQLWLPLTLTPAVQQSRVLWKLFTFARLKPGVTLDAAQNEMEIISDRLTAAYPDHYGNMNAVLTPVNDYLFSQYERLFGLLLGAVALVLLVSCANVTNLLLARSAEREREFSIRAALGASRGRIIRLWMLESALLSFTGAAIGIALAYVFVHPIVALLPASSRVPRIGEVKLDGPVLLFTIGISLLTTLLCGLAPALRLAMPNLNSSLKEGGRSGGLGVAGRRLGDALIVLETAVSLVLLVGAGLLLQSFLGLLGTHPGFRSDHVLAIAFNVPTYRYGVYESGGVNSARARLFDQLERRFSSIPGVRSATVAGSLPLRHGPNPWSMHIVGKAAPPPNAAAYGGAARNKKTGLSNHGDVSIQRVTPGYFTTFGMRLVRGRLFTERDNQNAPKVAIINESNARRYFGKDDPIGRTIVIDMTSYFPQLTVVGIVADSRLNALDKQVIPEVFWPMSQLPSPSGWLAMRTVGDPSRLATQAQAVLHQLDPDIAVSEVATMEAVASESVWRQRLMATLLTSFAALAALLAGAGIYAVFSYSVDRRRKELGIRIALGASRLQALQLILNSALKLSLLGIGIGLAAVVAAGRLLSTYLYGIKGYDARTLVAVSVFLLAVAALGSYWPARRAARTDPMQALQQ